MGGNIDTGDVGDCERYCKEDTVTYAPTLERRARHSLPEHYLRLGS